MIGAQWGDEGKGKIVDWLASRADVVVRFQGGHNAGHTLVVGNTTYKLSLLPSGIVTGTLSVIGVYAGLADKVPLGVAFNKGLHLHMGQMHGPKYIPRLFEHWQRGQVDPGFVFSHRLSLDDTPQAYRMFRDKRDGCVKVVMKPGLNRVH